MELCHSCAHYRIPAPGGRTCSGYIDEGGQPIPSPNYQGTRPRYLRVGVSECPQYEPLGPGYILLVEGEVSPRYFLTLSSVMAYAESLTVRWTKWNLCDENDGAVLRHHHMEKTPGGVLD